MTFPAQFQLSSLNGTNGFIINGISANDQSGVSVSSAGDINGDGFDDIIIGASFANPNGISDAGQSYVVFGKSGGFSTSFNLSTLNGTNGFALNGINAGDLSGASVSSAGDVNGDGFDDIIIGAPIAEPNGTSSGQSYVVFGKSGGFSASLNLSTLNGTNGFALNGINADDLLGVSVSSAGDVNGDGFDDIIIGARYADPNGSNSGQSYVVFGKSGGFSASLNLSTLNGTDGFALNGINAGDVSGVSVSSAGDVNGDRFDDIIIGARYADPNGSNSGQSYVVFGKSGGFSASLNLSTLNGTNGFALNGINANNHSGISVSSAGDVNGDGFDDLIIGAHIADPNGIIDAGQSYVVFGKSGGFSSSLNLSTLNGTNGFALNGINVSDISGVSVSSAGDVNGDGFDDLLIAAPLADSNASGSGQSYVVFGKSGGFSASLNLSTLNGTNGFALNGINNSDLSGSFVSGAGDVNGDGFDDLIIGARGADPNGSYSGQSYVVFGQSTLPSITLAVSPASVTEDGATNLVYTFTRTGSTINSLDVPYTRGGTATNGGDYNSSFSSSSITFAANASTATVTIDPIADSFLEADETVIFTINPNPSYVVGTANSATGTITNDDTPTISVAVSPGSVLEDGATNLVYTFTRTGSTINSLDVPYTRGGTATNGGDYNSSFSSSSITFAANASTATVTIDPIADSFLEADETVIFTINPNPSYVVGTANSATGTITNDDTPTISVAVSPGSVLEDGATNLVYTFTRTGSTINSLDVPYTRGGTATNGGDYNSSFSSSSITFAANASTATVTIDPIADSFLEADETVIFTINPNPSYVVGTANSATGTITNDDTPTISVAVSPGSVLEDGATNLVYTFTRTGSTINSLDVPYTRGGTATNGGDYNSSFSSSSITFAANASTATVTIDPIADSFLEADETVIFTINPNPSYVVGTANSATGTITNDDTPTISVAVSPGSVLEDGATNLVYTFTRTGSTTNALTVNYTVGGTATEGNDYNNIGSSVTFAAGSSTATVTVNPTADPDVEPDETVSLTLSANANYTIGTAGAVTGTITNDDVAPLPVITLAVSPSSVLEDDTTNLVYTFTRSGSTINPLTVFYSVGGTASNGSDYSSTPGLSPSITFAANASTATITIDPIADSFLESDETAILTLNPDVSYIVGTPNSATGTISNDDTPTITLAVSPSNVTEDGATNLVYTFTRSGSTINPLTVFYSVGGTASNGSDYSSTPGLSPSITFAANASTATITIDPIADSFLESDETAILTLNPDVSYIVGTPNSATGTISNDDTPTITLAVSPSNVTEDGATNLVYTFTRSGSTINPLTVFYSVGGTASNGSDYSSTPGLSPSITFAANASTATITIDPIADSFLESDETAILTLNPDVSYIVGTPNSATGTITNDDTPTISVAVSPSSVLEDSATNLVYTFTRTGSTTNALTVNYTVGGTATEGNDYNNIDSSVTFLAGSNTATVTVNPTADPDVEPDDTVALTLTANPNYTIGTVNAVTGTITNDDVTPLPVIILAVSPSSVLEDGATNLVYTFTRTGSTANALTVNYAVGGTATEGTDYNNIGSSVTFAAGSSTATVTVNPTADTVVESNETVALTLASETGYTIGTTTPVIGTILNDDVLPSITLAVAPTSVLEDGTGNLVYTFTRTGSTTNALTVDYNVGGTATNGNDYNNIGSSVTFAAGSSTATVTVNPTADTVVESNETVALTLASETGYTIGTTTPVIGTILNDDVLPSITLAVAPTSVLEDGTGNLVYTFTRTGSTTNALTVDYNVGGTATEGTDYNNIGSSVTFAAGSSTATVTVNPTADTTVESDETVSLNLASNANYTIGTPNAVTGTITNDDTTGLPVITLTRSPKRVAEDGSPNLIYTFTRIGNTNSALTVNYSIGGTATFSNDYTQRGASSFNGTTGTITFAANSATKKLRINPKADSIVEPEETVALTLTSNSNYTIGTTRTVRGIIKNDDGTLNLVGTSSNDAIVGTGSTDVMTGTLENAQLTGNTNDDRFIFHSTTEEIDHIIDFVPGDDFYNPSSAAHSLAQDVLGSIVPIQSANLGTNLNMISEDTFVS